MLRRYIASFLIASILAVLSLYADDFWIKKDWKHWSKDDCEKLLGESPGAHIWRDRDPGVNSLQAAETLNPARVDTTDFVVYSIQLRSALPVREAIVRKLQFDQKYDKMTDEQRRSFDSQAEQIINRSYDDAILVHVDFSKGTVGLRLAGDFHAYVAKGIEDLQAMLTTDDGTNVKPSRFDMNPKSVYAFDLVFPRLTNGVSVVKDNQKHFYVQFQSPQLLNASGADIAAKRVHVDFDLEKMSFGGKLSY